MINHISARSYSPSLASAQPKENISRQKLEKHLRDHKSGEGHRSKEMYAEVRKNLRENSEMLKDSNVSSLYASYTTLFSSYDKKARMSTHLNYVIKQTKKITDSTNEETE